MNLSSDYNDLTNIKEMKPTIYNFSIMDKETKQDMFAKCCGWKVWLRREAELLLRAALEEIVLCRARNSGRMNTSKLSSG